MDMIAEGTYPVYMLIRQYVMGIVVRPENNGKRIISIRELCKLFNVSHLTVMKALQELIDEGVLVTKPGIGTFVNVKARASFSELYPRIKQIGVIARTGKLVHYDYLYQRMMAGVFTSLGETGAMAQLLTPSSLDAGFNEVVEAMRLDGIIWVNPSESCMPCVEALDSAGFPLVTVTIHHPRIKSKNSVYSDFAQAGRLAGERLIDSGHERVLSVFNSNYKSAQVVAGMKSVCAERGVSLGDEFFLEGGEELLEKLDMMIKVGFKFTAVFADGNFCLPLYSVLENNGMRIPKDVELIGMEDAYSLMLDLKPDLMRCPSRDMGERSVAEIMRLIDGENEPREIALKWKLIDSAIRR